MKIQTLLFLNLSLLFLLDCNQPSSNINTITDLIEIPTPCKEGGESNLFVSETGPVYLSWVEYLNDSTDALVFSILKNKAWSAPKTIASGSNWFVNWADFPSLLAYRDNGNSLVAHWLQKSAEGTYDYDIHISQSHDAGRTWESSFIPHKDSISAEHGFVSMLALSADKVFATWLDGRKTKDGEGDAIAHDHGHDHDNAHAGAMTLRSAVFNKAGNLTEETELDDRVCDCCQTTAALTDKGVIVAYRDRSEKEIRDISVVRNIDNEWTKPKTVSKDEWLIAGCPVNGPSLAAAGKNVALAWFTMKGEKSIVKVAISNDSGESFDSAFQIDEGNPIGRVDVIWIAEQNFVVSWIEKYGEEAKIKLIKINETGKLGESMVIANTTASRQSGFPRMVKHGNEIIISWTKVEAEKTKVKTAFLKY